MTETKKPMPFSDKILGIMSEVGWIKKEGKNEYHKYKYAREVDVVDKLRDLFIKYRVYPARVNITRTASRVEQIDNSHYASEQVTFQMALKDADSEEVLLIEAPGTGFDKSDKAVYKAITGAEKYALLKAFLIPTGDDPEASNPEATKTSSARSWPTKEERAADASARDSWRKKQELEKTKAMANSPQKPTVSYPENDDALEGI